MTTLGEITVVQALAGGIFGWILVELWQRTIDGWNYDLIGFRKDWVTTTFIAMLITGLFIIFLFYVERPGSTGPNVGPTISTPELIGIGPSKTLVNTSSPVAFGPDYSNLTAIRAETVMGDQRIVPRTLSRRPGLPFVRRRDIVVPDLPLTGLLEDYDPEVLEDIDNMS